MPHPTTNPASQPAPDDAQAEAEWQFYLYAESLQYKKPQYDPFEAFQPSKSFLKEVIKSLSSQCLQLRRDVRSLQAEPGGELFTEIYEQQIEQLSRRIRDYQFRIRNSKKGNYPGNQIRQEHIVQAKQSSIQDYYHGQLRKAGKDLLGLCPFQPNDKHPSFTIYDAGRRFKCFSCGASGDVVDYIEQTLSLPFLAAVKYIINVK